jgi:glycosyltransferase involved in cell wall biosynthesis
VHIMNYSQFVPVVRRIHPKAKIVLHMQCEWVSQLDAREMEARIQHADLIIGCSEYITKKIAEAFPRFASRCVTVPNAADVVPEGGSRPDSKTVLFVGRLSPEKGLHDLIDAFHLVLQRFPDARLHLVGGAGSAPIELMVELSKEPQVRALRKFYEKNGYGAKDPYLGMLEKAAGAELGKRILFRGRVGHDQIERAYEEAAVLVNPSLSESFGISLVEAMMRRIAVVATRTGGMTYTVDPGVTGYLVEPANPAALADAICEVLADPERARKMGEAGRVKAVEKFSWEKTAGILLEHLRNVI